MTVNKQGRWMTSSDLRISYLRKQKHGSASGAGEVLAAVPPDEAGHQWQAGQLVRSRYPGPRSAVGRDASHHQPRHNGQAAQ